jgi:hypothetical protein
MGGEKRSGPFKRAGAMTDVDLRKLVVAIASAIAAIFAVRSTLRSVPASETPAKDAVKIARRSLIRDVATAARRVVDLAEAITTISEKSRAQEAALYPHTGNSQDVSARQVFAKKIADRLTSFAPVRDQAEVVGPDYARLAKASSEELLAWLAKFSAESDHLDRILDEATAELSNLKPASTEARKRRPRLRQSPV